MWNYIIYLIVFETRYCFCFNLTIPDLPKNLCEEYNSVLHDDQSSSSLARVKKFCSKMNFEIEVDDAVLVMCILELKDSNCSLVDLCSTKVLGKWFFNFAIKTFICGIDVFRNCVDAITSKLNIKVVPLDSLDILRDDHSNQLMENTKMVHGYCMNQTEDAMFDGFSYFPFCSRLSIKVVKDFNGNIDFSVWNSASKELVCKL